jgi:hypothetical protein
VPRLVINSLTSITVPCSTAHDSSDWDNIILSHRINSALSQTIAAAMTSLVTNFITLNYIRHTATWAIINRVLLATELFTKRATTWRAFASTFNVMGGCHG